MHIPANYSCDSWAVLLDMTRDLCIILFMCSLLKLSHELYLHLHMCSLLSLLNMRSLLYLLYMCSLLKCDYLFCNYSLSLFVILRLELHVYIMLTFMFCEINYIDIYNSHLLSDLPPSLWRATRGRDNTLWCSHWRAARFETSWDGRSRSSRQMRIQSHPPEQNCSTRK